MTAEIAVMNKMAVALAADSAITIRVTTDDSDEPERTKIYHSNKLFTLSKYHPIGVMIFNNAEMMNVPWETIIKVFRKQLGDIGLDHLEEYGERFIGFLNNNVDLFPEVEQEAYLYTTLTGYLLLIKGRIDKEVENITHKKGTVTSNQVRNIVTKVVRTYHGKLANLPDLSTIPVDFGQQVRRKYDAVIDKAITDVLGKFPLSTVSSRRVKQFCLNLLLKNYTEPDYSGIVVAGFGVKDIFPALVSYKLEGVINGTLRYKSFRNQKIGRGTAAAAIVPFAQDEMVHTFMRGVDPGYQSVLDGYLTALFEKYPEDIAKGLPKLSDKEKATFISKMKSVGQTLTQQFSTALSQYTQQQNVDPIISTVAFLPSTDLALMAETLVNLTSFKRRVTMVAETVGGPIDVAVISKGDGFVWINRKHYFEPETNHQFFANYFR